MTIALPKIIRFIGIGGLNTLIYFLVSWLLIAVFKTDAKVTNVAAYAVGMVAAYFGHRRVTFASRGKVSGEVWRFCVTHAVNLLLSTIFLMVVVDRLGVSRFAGTVLAAILIMCSSFVIMQLWVFRDHGPGKA